MRPARRAGGYARCRIARGCRSLRDFARWRTRGQRDARPPGEGALQEAIGRQIREFRTALGMTVAELGRQSDLSAGAISKIERGLTPPSLTSLSAIAGALAVPVTALFRKHEEQRDASYVEAGKGLVIERRGTRVGHRYELLGHTISGRVAIEPYLVTLTEESEVFPLFQHAGIEFIHLLEGEVVYRAAGTTYRLRPGDSLLFDGDVAHGPEELVQLPIRMLAIISRPARNGDASAVSLSASAVALLFGAATLCAAGGRTRTATCCCSIRTGDAARRCSRRLRIAGRFRGHVAWRPGRCPDGRAAARCRRDAATSAQHASLAPCDVPARAARLLALARRRSRRPALDERR